MLYLTCTMTSSVDLARFLVSRAKDLVSMDFGSKFSIPLVCCLRVIWSSI